MQYFGNFDTNYIIFKKIEIKKIQITMFCGKKKYYKIF